MLDVELAVVVVLKVLQDVGLGLDSLNLRSIVTPCAKGISCMSRLKVTGRPSLLASVMCLRSLLGMSLTMKLPCHLPSCTQLPKCRSA